MVRSAAGSRVVAGVAGVEAWPVKVGGAGPASGSRPPSGCAPRAAGRLCRLRGLAALAGASRRSLLRSPLLPVACLFTRARACGAEAPQRDSRWGEDCSMRARGAGHRCSGQVVTPLQGRTVARPSPSLRAGRRQPCGSTSVSVAAAVLAMTSKTTPASSCRGSPLV